ncbi:hypothetical protein [Sneathiella glossodoripedis]|uniref:hypothetical protein n=1 Tax=Sneathiella glossodoripedis TaxID=418853 RepID=UPI000472127A|nr:hypothetical protein [Sneathiella glossodoripedis]
MGDCVQFLMDSVEYAKDSEQVQALQQENAQLRAFLFTLFKRSHLHCQKGTDSFLMKQAHFDNCMDIEMILKGGGDDD